MNVYSTYKEAVIANGNTKGVYKNRESEKFAAPSLVGAFWKNYWEECNPADYLESVADFQARGKLLALGDDVVSINGHVLSVKRHSYNMWNLPSDDHDKRFVLQAAADTETPEEREVFEAMSESVNATTWEPVVGDEVSTCEGVGKVLTTVVRDNLTGYIVQFENDWNEFDISELKPVDQDYENGKTVYELFISCKNPSIKPAHFSGMSVNMQKRWIEFAKLVKPVDCKVTRGRMEI